MTKTRPNLLSILQLCDSSFPIGAYAHSWGLETWTQSEDLKNAGDVEKSLRSLLQLSIAPKEGSAVKLSHQYAMDSNLQKFIELNAQLSASNWSQEIQSASFSMGDRLKTLVHKLDWLEELPVGRFHHCSTFGWICGKLAITLDDAIKAYLFSSISSLTAASVKLVPLGHTDGQRIISNMAEYIEIEVEKLCQPDRVNSIQSFAPLQEWASFEHERLYSRQFQS